MAFLLRHEVTYEFEPGGWQIVNDLIMNHGFSCSVLESIVASVDMSNHCIVI